MLKNALIILYCKYITLFLDFIYSLPHLSFFYENIIKRIKNKKNVSILSMYYLSA